MNKLDPWYTAAYALIAAGFVLLGGAVATWIAR